MRSFLKFIVTVLVIGVVGVSVGYLLVNGAKPRQEQNVIVPGEKLNVPENISIVEPPQEELEKIMSGEEWQTEISGEEATNVKIEKINQKISQVVFTSIDEGVHATLEPEYLNQSAKDAMAYFKAKTLGVTICSGENAVMVIPDSDFVENMEYYYDEKGNLLVYRSVSTTVGGSSTYYFDLGENIDLVVAYEEEVSPTLEDSDEILARAQRIYEAFLLSDTTETETIEDLDELMVE